MKDPKQYVGMNIRRHRTNMGMNAHEFAELFNATEPKDIRTTMMDVYKWETNKSNPPGYKYVKAMALRKRRS